VGVLDAGGRDRVVGDVVLDDFLGAVGLGDVLLPLLLGLALRVALRLRRRLEACVAVVLTGLVGDVWNGIGRKRWPSGSAF
jgi:hypothetical protein